MFSDAISPRTAVGRAVHIAWILAACIASGCGSNDQRTFDTPEAAAEALILAAEHFDVQALQHILGPDGVHLVVTEDAVQDKNQSLEFAAVARQQTKVERDATNAQVAVLYVGPEEWPLPIPLVESRGKWRFDSSAGQEEVLNRRIGRNELDAIEICHGYVEAQLEYASEPHDGAPVRHYAERIISTQGKQDGLAWMTADGNWEGPVGEAIARVIAEGYTEKREPYHGYYFKILKGQGPAAPMGALDFVVKGLMIGGFALVAAPADYDVTGVMTFLVSHNGIVYEKDLGPATLEQFWAMERYNPDPSWNPLPSP
jgi:hypothetical protein